MNGVHLTRHINCGDIDEVVLIPVGDGTAALVSKQDACLVRLFRWQWNGAYVFAQMKGRRRGRDKPRDPTQRIYLHRLILGVHGLKGPEHDVSHANGDTRDCTRSNISVRGRTINNQLAVITREMGLYGDEAERVRRVLYD